MSVFAIAWLYCYVIHVVAKSLSFYQTDLPSFQGSPEQRLRTACLWVAEYCPGRQLTLEEVGQVMGVTRERVRQIEALALRKLRHPTRIKLLK